MNLTNLIRKERFKKVPDPLKDGWKTSRDISKEENISSTTAGNLIKEGLDLGVLEKAFFLDTRVNKKIPFYRVIKKK